MTTTIDVNNKYNEIKEKLNKKYDYLTANKFTDRIDFLLDTKPYYTANTATAYMNNSLLTYSYQTLDKWIQRFNDSYYYMDLVIDNNIYVYKNEYSFKKHLEIAYRHWVEDNIKKDSKLVLDYMKLRLLIKVGTNFISVDEFQSIGNCENFPTEMIEKILDL